MKEIFSRGGIVVAFSALVLLACTIGPVTISMGPTATPVPTATPPPTSTPVRIAPPIPTLAPSPTPAPIPTRLSPAPSPGGVGAFGAIKFAAGVMSDDTPVDVRTTFPDGITRVYGAFDYKGLKDGQTYKSEWLLDGKVQPGLTGEMKWSGGSAGNWWASINNENGLTSGKYQLNLYLENQLQQSAQMTIEANPTGQPDFGPIVFAPDVDAKGNPVNPAPANNPTLPAGTKKIYAFFNAVNVPKGTQWTTQWFRNNKPESENQRAWDSGLNDSYWVSFFYTEGSALAAGTYELKLTIGSRLVNLGVFMIK